MVPVQGGSAMDNNWPSRRRHALRFGQHQRTSTKKHPALLEAGRMFVIVQRLKTAAIFMMPQLLARGYANCAGRTAPGSQLRTPWPAETAWKSGTPAQAALP